MNSIFVETLTDFCQHKLTMKKYYRFITLGLGFLGLALNVFGADEKASDVSSELSDLPSKVRANMAKGPCWGTDALRWHKDDFLRAMEQHDSLMMPYNNGGSSNRVLLCDLTDKKGYDFSLNENGLDGLDNCQVRAHNYPNMKLTVRDGEVILILGTDSFPVTEEKFPGSNPSEVSKEGVREKTISFTNGKWITFRLLKDGSWDSESPDQRAAAKLASDLLDLPYEVQVNKGSNCFNTLAYNKLMAAMQYHETLVAKPINGVIAVYDLEEKEVFKFHLSGECDVEIEQVPNLKLTVVDYQIVLICGDVKMTVTNWNFPGSNATLFDDAKGAHVSFINGGSRHFELKNGEWSSSGRNGMKIDL